MKVVIEMTLPRDAGSAPLARHTLDASLRGLGVGADVRADIALALGEACANVIQHANESRQYEVRASVDETRCVIDVIDAGSTVDPGAVDNADDTGPWNDDARLYAENGRGLHLMRAFTEDLKITDRVRRPGSVVHFEKSLVG